MLVTRNDAEAQQTLNCGPDVPPFRRVPKEVRELIERVYVHRDDLLDALRGDEGARPNAVRELGGVIRRRVLAPEGKTDGDHATVGFLKRVPAACFLRAKSDPDGKEEGVQDGKREFRKQTRTFPRHIVNIATKAKGDIVH